MVTHSGVDRKAGVCYTMRMSMRPKPVSAKQTERFQIKLCPDLRERAIDAAAERGVSLAELFRMGVEQIIGPSNNRIAHALEVTRRRLQHRRSAGEPALRQSLQVRLSDHDLARLDLLASRLGETKTGALRALLRASEEPEIAARLQGEQKIVHQGA